jgi:hypothetical protein
MVTRLFTITSGPLPPNPVELLSSAKMLDLLSVAAERFDIVMIDGPPVIGLADALILANLAKATLFVVNAETTRRREIGGAVKRLRQANAHSARGRAREGRACRQGLRLRLRLRVQLRLHVQLRRPGRSGEPAAAESG